MAEQVLLPDEQVQFRKGAADKETKCTRRTVCKLSYNVCLYSSTLLNALIARITLVNNWVHCSNIDSRLVKKRLQTRLSPSDLFANIKRCYFVTVIVSSSYIITSNTTRSPPPPPPFPPLPPPFPFSSPTPPPPHHRHHHHHRYIITGPS